MSNTPSDEELTACYREANGEMHGKAQPLTTQRIFRAMRAAIVKWGTPQPVVREPLTDEQIESLLWTHGYDPDDEHMAEMLQAAVSLKRTPHAG